MYLKWKYKENNLRRKTIGMRKEEERKQETRDRKKFGQRWKMREIFGEGKYLV